MKIKKFGQIWLNQDGVIQISGFMFIAENFLELGRENDAEHVIPVIAHYLASTCKNNVIDPPFDKRSEMVVMRALQRARS